MSEKRRMPAGEEDKPPVTPPAEPQASPEAPNTPTSTGDMQEVGAVEPQEVPEREREIDGEAPVHENPGDQNSG